MKKGTTATIKVDLQLEGVQKIIFTFNNSDATTTEPTLQKVFPGNDVRHENDGYYIGLNQTDTEKLDETFYLEAQVNFIGGAVTKSLIKKVKMPHTLFTEKLTQSASNGEEVDVELEIESVVETVSVDYEDLENKPQINNITLIGNKTAHDLGLATPSEVESAEQSAKDYADNIALNLGNNLAVSINTQTYVLTFTLKHDNGTLSTASVDLPLESTVVSGRYDKTSKKLILTLVSGETIEIPLGDLIDGLVSTDDLASALANYQPKITPQNKISADNVDDSESENQFTNATEKTYWNNKPNVFRGNDKPTNVITDYPNVKGGDLYINQQADYVNRIWYCESVFGETVNWQISVRNIFYGTTPFTSWQDMNTQTNMSSMQKGTLYEKTNGDVYILTDNTSATWVWSKIATQSDLSNKQDLIDSSHKLSADLISNGTNNQIVPSSAQADSGKFLVVDSNGNPIWKTIPRAEDNSF